MAKADDPIGQALSQIDACSGGRGGVLGFLREHGFAFLARLVETFDAINSGNSAALLAPAAELIGSLKSARAIEDLHYLLSVVAPEVQRLMDRFDTLEEDRRRFLKEELPILFLSAHQKAGEDPFQRRRERIGEIIKNATIRCPKDADADEVEELLRIAGLLTEQDAIILREIFQAQRRGLGSDRRVQRTYAFSGWPSGNFHKLGLNDGQVESSCAKLYGFGLVRPCVDERLNNNADMPVAYGLLPKGVQFIEFSTLVGDQKATA